MENKECDFCGIYSALKRQPSALNEDRYEMRYFIRLVRRIYDKEYVNYIGDYTLEYMPFNYCPECGRKLKENE